MQWREQSKGIGLFFIIFSSMIAFVTAFGRQVFFKIGGIASAHYDLGKPKALFSSLGEFGEHSGDYHSIYLKLINQTVVSVENSRNEKQIEQDELRAIESFDITRRVQHLSSIKNSAHAIVFAELSRSLDTDKKPTLISVIKKRNLHLAKAYCAEPEDNSDFFTRDSQGNTPLHLCVLLNCPDIFDVISDRYKDLMTSKNNHGDTVLHLAIQQRNTVLFNKILKINTVKHLQSQLLLSPNALGLLPLSLAAAMGYIDMVRPLLNQYNALRIDLKPHITEALEFAKTARSFNNDSSEAAIVLNGTYSFEHGRDETPGKFFVPRVQHRQVIQLFELTLNPKNQSLEGGVVHKGPMKRKLF